MKRNVLAVALLAVAVVASVFVLPASLGAPPQPYNYNGVARAADGTTFILQGQRITTFIDGVDYSNGTSVYNTVGGYDVDVYGNWYTNFGLPNTPQVKEGGDIGDGVMFVRGDMTGSGDIFTAQGTWASNGVGGTENRDLTLAVNQPGGMAKIARIITQPADGLTQYLYLCNRGPGQVDLTQYAVQKDGTGSATNYLGPRQLLTAGNTQPTMLPAGQLAYVNLNSWDVGATTLANSGDALKLVWDNPGGTGFGGSDIIVDRVEYNQTGGGGGLGLIGEPSNTTMSDARAPGLGQEIRRSVTPFCTDTNDNWADFTLSPETGRPGTNNPPVVTVTAPVGTDDWTGGMAHNVQWTMTDDVAGPLTYAVDADLDGSLTYITPVTAGGAGAQGPNSFPWSVPLVDTTLATIRACAVDAGGLPTCAFSPRFTIDSTRPVLSTTSPTDGATGVDVNTDIILTFSERMNQAATNGAVTINPGAVPFASSWDGTGRILTANPNSALAGDTQYTVTVSCAALDISVTGNQLASCPRSFGFRTAVSNVAPTPSITRPVGGEDWSGGRSQFIRFTITDPDSPQVHVYVNISTDGGATFPTNLYDNAAVNSNTPQSIGMTIPNTNTANAMIRVEAVDPTFMTGRATSAAFRIDAIAPTVLTVDPAGTDINVPTGKPLTITFSEPMNQTATVAAFSISSAVGDPGGWVATWTAADTLRLSHNDFAGCTQYTATFATGAKDLSDPGNPIPAQYQWSFTTACAPTVAVTAPAAGADWTGGSTQGVTFTVTDTDSGNVHVWVNLSTDGGTTFPTNVYDSGIGYTVPTGAAQSPTFTVPSVDTTTAVLKVTAKDATGLEGSGNSATFQIDSLAPTVTGSTPTNAATGVSLTADLSLTFSEAMAQTATQGAITLTYTGGSVTLTPTWSSATVVTLSHAKLKAATQYTLTVGTGAKDLSDPGNFLAAAHTVQFTTTPVTGLTATISGPDSGTEGDVLSYDGTGSTGGVTGYAWTCKDPNGATAGTGTQSTVSCTFSTQGNWIVNLTVSDAAGNTASAQKTVNIIRKVGTDFLSQYWWILVILLIAVIGAILFLVLGRRRKKKEEPEAVPPEEVETVPPAKPGAPPKKAAPPSAKGGAAAAPAKGAPKAGTKECPTCGTILEAKDTECFMCGAKV